MRILICCLAIFGLTSHAGETREVNLTTPGIPQVQAVNSLANGTLLVGVTSLPSSIPLRYSPAELFVLDGATVKHHMLLPTIYPGQGSAVIGLTARSETEPDAYVAYETSNDLWRYRFSNARSDGGTRLLEVQDAGTLRMFSLARGSGRLVAAQENGKEKLWSFSEKDILRWSQIIPNAMFIRDAATISGKQIVILYLKGDVELASKNSIGALQVLDSQGKRVADYELRGAGATLISTPTATFTAAGEGDSVSLAILNHNSLKLTEMPCPELERPALLIGYEGELLRAIVQRSSDHAFGQALINRGCGLVRFETIPKFWTAFQSMGLPTFGTAGDKLYTFGVGETGDRREAVRVTVIKLLPVH